MIRQRCRRRASISARGGRDTAHAAASRDVDAGERRVYRWTGADCDGVGAASYHRERYRQYGAEGPQREHRGSQHIASETFGSTSWSRQEIHAGPFVNLDHEARAHKSAGGLADRAVAVPRGTRVSDWML